MAVFIVFLLSLFFNEPIFAFRRSNVVRKAEEENFQSWWPKETSKYPDFNDKVNSCILILTQQSCYVCGGKEYGIPTDNSCAVYFETTEDYRMKFAAERFARRNQCWYRFRKDPACQDMEHEEFVTEWISVWKQIFKKALRVPNRGCFKRWVDLNGIYTERGRRSYDLMRPPVGKSIISRRLSKLERNLYNVSDGCFASPMAILTPFSRSVTLFARYHTCVCSPDLCNKANTLNLLHYYYYFAILVVLNYIKNNI